MVEGDIKAREVASVLGVDSFDHRLGGQAQLAGIQLDGRAVRVIRADIERVDAEVLEGTDVDVRLAILHQVAEVKAAVGVG